jgi:hypothetical protein
MSTIGTQKKTSWLGGQKATKFDPPVIVTDEQVRRRAHEIYLARGGKPGNPIQDWLQAEKELKATQSRR